MTLSIEWHCQVGPILEAHAGLGIPEAKEVGRVVELLHEAAGGKWHEFGEIEVALTQGKSLRTFEAGSVVVIIQVLPPVNLRVVDVGISISVAQWPHFVAQAAAKV